MVAEQRLVAVKSSRDRCNIEKQLIQYFECFSVAVAATTDEREL